MIAVAAGLAVGLAVAITVVVIRSSRRRPQVFELPQSWIPEPSPGRRVSSEQDPPPGRSPRPRIWFGDEPPNPYRIPPYTPGAEPLSPDREYFSSDDPDA
jgi:hypothetical protein